jgi:Zn-dependent peptidase ImmA (M78 family)
MTPEQAARQVLEKTNLSTPVDVYLIAQMYDVSIQEREMEDAISGMLAITDGRAIIVVNKDHAPRRQRFTIAHELGHFFLHRNSTNVFIDVSPIYFRNRLSSEGTNLREQEANRFAAELLMPAHLLREKVHHKPIDAMDDDAVSCLADEFQVSVQSLTIRLTNLNLISLH